MILPVDLNCIKLYKISYKVMRFVRGGISIMERISPVPGQIYKHFKNKMYQIIAVATHSESKEKMVVYQGLYGDFGVYVRPYDMFMSEVDHVKYPEVAQKYRFECVGVIGQGCNESNIENKIEVCNIVSESVKEEVCEETGETIEEANPDLIAFLDAETYEEKRELLVAMRPRITDRLINDIAVSLDVIVEEGDLEKRFRSLLYCVSKLDEYEVNRLR